MKTTMKTGMEVIVTTPDERGVLSRISTVITEAHVNIRAICAYAVDQVAHLRLITDNNKRTIEALNNAGFTAKEEEVIISEVSPHILHPEVASLAGNFDVENNYWCASAHSGEHAVLIFSPKDNLKGALVS